MKVKSESEVAQSCQTPSDPMDFSPPGSSIQGVFQARVLEWGAITFSELSGTYSVNSLGKGMIHGVRFHHATRNSTHKMHKLFIAGIFHLVFLG